ncbi:hypothetical protein LAZ67_18000983 [Cordylochernes scorpioides]|uniref:Uncharacterized protein n=1 Tax=Cordylochernes scorpioides TaxID=51811 RepID=A0ABY6LFB6_9ARAC|nr:hypothetical protein LAZ67_18000983 [Cordylochernes scorpioides]
MWTETLPTVLLGLRAVCAINKDNNHSLSQMVYGKTIRLPGEFFDDSKHHPDAEEFVQQLQKNMEMLKPLNEKHHSKTKNSLGVINMSSTKLSVEEERILSLGLRFVPPNKSIPDIPKIIAGVEGAIRSLNHVETLKVRNAVTQVLYRSTQQTVPSNRYHSPINRLRKSRSIVITKSDKGNQTISLKVITIVDILEEIVIPEIVKFLISM